MWTFLAWISAGAVSLVSLKYLTIHYLWIFLAGAMALFVTAATDARRCALWFNLACLSLGLGIFEYYLWRSGPAAYAAGRVEGGNAAELLYVPHDQLGYAPQPGTVVTEKLSFAGEVVFDAVYTIGPNGLRISQPARDRQESPRECILFFGDSFTFGQGLADHETLPYRVGEQLPPSYRTYNFGVNGYGAHQMLSALQQGRVEQAVQCGPEEISHVFYQGIKDHVGRSAGKILWESRGPRYIVTEDGGVRLDGRLDDLPDDRSPYEMVLSQITKSNIYARAWEGRYTHKYARDDIELYAEIIDESRQAVRSRFPSAEFHVLWWDEDSLDNRTVRSELGARDITVHLMSDILPGYRTDDVNLQYRLHERDMHPNPAAVELIAAYVARAILGKAPISLRSVPAQPRESA